MTHVMDFLIRLKSVRKGGLALPLRHMRDALLTEHLGPEMHAKLNQVYRERRRRGTWL